MIVLARVYSRLQLEAERSGYWESANARFLGIHWTRVPAADGLVLLWMLSRAREAARRQTDVQGHGEIG
jgi:hypothetical protein